MGASRLVTPDKNGLSPGSERSAGGGDGLASGSVPTGVRGVRVTESDGGSFVSLSLLWVLVSVEKEPPPQRRDDPSVGGQTRRPPGRARRPQ